MISTMSKSAVVTIGLLAIADAATTTRQQTTLNIGRRLAVSSTCSAQPVESTSSSLNCDTQGHLAYPSSPIDSFSATDPSECGYACLTEGTCVSFGFNSTGVCNLFNATLDQQGLINKKTDYGAVFYNVRYPRGEEGAVEERC